MVKYIMVDVFELDEQATALRVEEIKKRVAGTSDPDDWTHSEEFIIQKANENGLEHIDTLEQAIKRLEWEQILVVEY